MHFFLVTVIFLFLVLTVSLALAGECECGRSFDGCIPCNDPEKAGETVSKAVEIGEPIDNANLPEGTKVNLQGGIGLSIGGDTSVSNSQIDTAQATTDSGADMKKVKGLRGDGAGGFKADSSQSFSYMGFDALNANNIHATDNSLTIGSADEIKYKGMTLTDAKILTATEDELSIINAGKIEGQGLNAEDIKNTLLKFDNGLSEIKIISDKDNNTVSFLDGKLNITMDKNDVAKVTKAGDKYNVDLDSENATVRDTGKVACAEISAGSRYRYVGENFDHFGLYIPSNADNFNLCIRTESEEQYPTNCSQCGVMDFYNQSFVLNGHYEYERKDAVDPRI